MTNEELLSHALKARENSYSPYSHFPVGAALLCKDGEIYYGTNIENASYPNGICAERSAIHNAINHGKRSEDFVALALIADTSVPCTPCGACRQVISEHLPAKTPIIMGNLKGDIQISTPEELLPFAFVLEDKA